MHSFIQKGRIDNFIQQKNDNMKVFVEKTLPNVENEVKMTKTSKYLRLLIKSCILPIKITDNKVIFRFFSTKMLFHILGIFVFAVVSINYGFIFFPTEFRQMWKKVLENESSWIEQLSMLCGLGPIVLISLPTVIGLGLKNMGSDFFQNPNLKWPKIAKFNIAGTK